MIIFLHINTPWIKHYCFIWSSPWSTNLVTLAKPTICRYCMCKLWKLSNEYFLHDINFKSSSFPQFCVQSYGRFLHRLHPTTIYILMHNFIISYRAGFNLSLLKRAKKLSLIWYQKYLDMWSIFGVKLNYIVIYEKLCNSSTLLMELFMICDPLYWLLAPEERLNQDLVGPRKENSVSKVCAIVSYQFSKWNAISITVKWKDNLEAVSIKRSWKNPLMSFQICLYHLT